jgi:hypothetical protein
MDVRHKHVLTVNMLDYSESFPTTIGRDCPDHRGDEAQDCWQLLADGLVAGAGPQQVLNL